MLNFKKILSLFLVFNLVLGQMAWALPEPVKDTAELRLLETFFAVSGKSNAPNFMKQALLDYLNDPSYSPEKANENLVEALNTLGLTDPRYNSQVREALNQVTQNAQIKMADFEGMSQDQKVQALKKITAPLAQVIQPTGNLYSAQSEPKDCEAWGRWGWGGGGILGMASAVVGLVAGDGSAIANACLYPFFAGIGIMIFSVAMYNHCGGR